MNRHRESPPRAGRGGVCVLALGLAACPAAERATKTATPDARPAAAPPPCERAPRRFAPADLPPVDSQAALAALERGVSRAKAADWPEAEAAYRAALEQDPGLGLAHLGLADALAYTGGAPETRRRHLAHAIVDLPRNPQAHARFAESLAATDEPTLALRHLRCALDLKPSLRPARRRAAHLALDLEGAAAAEQMMQPLLTGTPEASDWLLASRVYDASGARAEAARAMEAAAEVARSAPLYRRAAALWAEAGEAEARERAERAAEVLDPKEERRLRPLRRSRRRR